MNLLEEYNNIKTPKELSEFMKKHITYGYLGKSGNIYHFNDEGFNEKWKDEYILENYIDVLNNKIGNCFDQVELERNWFNKNNYEFKTIYHQVMLDYDNPYPTHTFLVYKENESWYWFENAWEDMSGIHKFNTLDELLKYEYEENLKFLKTYNITQDEINKIQYFEYEKPNEHLSSIDYLNHVANLKKRIFL